eukprot:s312_g14.t2
MFGLQPELSVGPGMLNSNIIQKFAASNGMQAVLKAALLVGDIVPEGEGTKRKHRRIDVRSVQKRQTDESEIRAVAKTCRPAAFFAQAAPHSRRQDKAKKTRFRKMSKTGSGADLRKFMEKRLDLKLTANRHVVGVLRGYDQFMNIVLDNTVEIVSPTEKNEIGMVVIRGWAGSVTGRFGSRFASTFGKRHSHRTQARLQCYRKMSKTGSGADLRKFMEKRLDLKLTANRHVVGVLRGYDQFMNIVLDNTVEIADSSEDLEDFQWAALAESLEAFDVSWAAFSEFWYEAAAEDWRFHHYAIFAQSLHALHTAGLKVLAPPCSWTLHAAAFESEWLARRLRPIPNDLDPWQGIDLRALNALHAGQPKSGFSADVFPLVSTKMLRIVSHSAEVLHLPCRWDSRLEDWQSIELSVQRPAHGVLLWIQPKSPTRALAQGIQWEPPWSSPQTREVDQLTWARLAIPSAGEANKDSSWPSPIFEAVTAPETVQDQVSTSGIATSSCRFVEEHGSADPGEAQDPVARCLDFSDEIVAEVNAVPRRSDVSQAPVPGRGALEVAKELELLLGWLLSERLRERDRIDSKLASRTAPLH